MRQRKFKVKLTGLVVALAVGTSLGWAQQKKVPSATVRMQAMHSMMQNSGHAGGVHAVIAKLQAAITRARESTDPATTKTALAAAQVQLAKLEQMERCSMSGMMMKPGGMMGGKMMEKHEQRMPMKTMKGMSGNRGAWMR